MGKTTMIERSDGISCAALAVSMGKLSISMADPLHCIQRESLAAASRGVRSVDRRVEDNWSPKGVALRVRASCWLAEVPDAPTGPPFRW
jgi:hypothetical protein